MSISTPLRGRMPLLFTLVSSALILVACGGGGSSAEGTDAAAQQQQSTQDSTATSTSQPDMTTQAKRRAAVLTWTASSSASVVGYRVYYGTTPGSYLQAAGSGVAAGTDCTLTISGLTSGTTYYFAVSAVDADGNESDLTAEVSKTIS